MAWRDNLHLEGKGSFRNVDFYVASVSSTVGRRTVTHEFPGQDTPQTEDLGRAGRKFTLECFVLGPDYMEDRDKLRDAFEMPGPGPLTHPYWGHMTVCVTGGVRIQETTAEGGMARFTLDVVEADPKIKFFAAPDTEEEVEEAAEEVKEAAAEEYEEEWTLVGAIAETIQAAVDAVNAVTSTINQIKGKINAVMNTIDTIGDAITEFGDTISDIISLPGQIAETFTGLIEDVVGVFDTIGDSFADYFDDDERPGDVAGTPSTSPTASNVATGSRRAEAVMEAFRDMIAAGSDLDDVMGTTSQPEIERGNQEALLRLNRMVCTAEICKTAVTLPYASRDQAFAVRDELADEIDALADDANDRSYAALMDLRAALVKHMDEAAQALPRVITYTPSKTLPALVIAQHLYADSDRDIDIINRNNIRNPCKVPGGDGLEVLSDE